MFETLGSIPGIVTTQLPDDIFRIDIPAINKSFKIHDGLAFEDLVVDDKLIVIVDNDENPPMLRMCKSADDNETFVIGGDLLCDVIRGFGIEDMRPIPMFITAVGNNLIVGKHYNNDKHYEIKKRSDGVFEIKQL